MVILFGSYLAVALLLMPWMIKASNNSSGNATLWMILWPLATTLTACVLSVAKDIGFIMWARGKLNRSFRQQASRSFNQPRSKPPATSPPAPPPPTPPVPPAIPPPIGSTTVGVS
jgi:hypothetical protein